MAFEFKKSGLAGFTLLSLLCGATAAAQLLPEDMLEENQDVEDIRYYSVEVIVFEYASSVSAGNELFEPEQSATIEDPIPESPVPVFGDTVPNAGDVESFSDFDDPVEDEVTELSLIPSLADIGFQLQAAEQLSMGDIHEKLVSLDAYQPVLWTGWIQSTHEREFSPLIPLRILGTPPIRIEGTLQLYLKNYLHLVVDVTKEQHIATMQPAYQFERTSRADQSTNRTDTYRVDERQTIVYQIQEDRLFQSGQLRYYDHPKFGVLARVNRVEDTQPDDDAEDESPGRTMLSNAE